MSLKILSRSKFLYDYDRKNDVLYISIGSPKPAYGSGDFFRGIVVRRSLENNEIVGLTIIAFKRSYEDGWLVKLKDQIPPLFSLKLLERIYNNILQRRDEGEIDPTSLE